MRAGELRHLLVLQTRAESRNAMGGTTPTWTNTTQLWGKVDESGGGEKVNGQQTDGSRTVMVTIRYLSSIDPSQRFMHDGQALNIVAIADPDGRRRMLEIQCRKDD